MTKRHAETLATMFDEYFADLKPHPATRYADFVVSDVGGGLSPDASAIKRFLDESPKQIAALFGIDRLGAEAYPVPPRPGADVRRTMGLDLAGRSPHDQNEPPRDRLGRQDGLIGRVEPIALAADPLLRRFDIHRAQAARGQHGPPGPFPDADDDVAAVQVVIVVGERADRPQHLGTGGARVQDALNSTRSVSTPRQRRRLSRLTGRIALTDELSLLSGARVQRPSSAPRRVYDRD